MPTKDTEARIDAQPRPVPLDSETLQRAATIIDEFDAHELFDQLDAALVDRGHDLDDELTSLVSDLRALAEMLRTGERDPTLDPGDEPALHEVTATICSLCLDGAGGECHVPGCVFWCHDAPAPADRGATLRKLLTGVGSIDIAREMTPPRRTPTKKALLEYANCLDKMAAAEFDGWASFVAEVRRQGQTNLVVAAQGKACSAIYEIQRYGDIVAARRMLEQACSMLARAQGLSTAALVVFREPTR